MPFTKIDASNLGGTTLPALNGSALTNISAGKVGQLLQSQDNTQTTISSESFGSISLSQAITPSATSSKVLITGYVNFYIDSNNQDKGLGLRIRRDTTAIQTSTTHYDMFWKPSVTAKIADRFSFMYIDTPSSTSAITYSVRISAVNNLNVLINYASNYSQIQCWEILA